MNEFIKLIYIKGKESFLILKKTKFEVLLQKQNFEVTSRFSK